LTARCDTARPPASTRCPPVPLPLQLRAVLDREPLALPISLVSRRLRSISGRSRRSSPSCSIRSKANSTASWPRAPQRMDASVVAGDHRLAADQERRCLDAADSIEWPGSGRPSVMAALGEAANPRAVPAQESCRAIADRAARHRMDSAAQAANRSQPGAGFQ
jgi:hypothetical protein